MKTFTLASFFLLLTFVVSYGQAQTNPADTLYRIETKDGNVFIGKLVEINMDKVVIHNETMGRISLSMEEVIRIERFAFKGEKVYQINTWYRNLQSARYFFAPNGYGLKKGESYYQNTWIFYNQFSGGVTDNFSMGIGIIPLFLFDFAPTPVWLTPKLSIPVVENKLNIGAGGLIGYIVGEDIGFGIFYGSATIGSYDKNLTIGAGYAYAGGEALNYPLINISGLARSGKRSYLMMENYILVDSGQIGMLSILGGRSMINKSAIDYGLALPLIPDMGGFVAIPWLGITVPFSKNSK